MEKNNVGEEGDEGPGLFRIPIPEATPGVVGPNAAEDDSDSEKKNADLQTAIKVKDPRIICRRYGMGSKRADDKEVGEAGCEGEGAVAEGDGENVDGEPEITAQDRNKRIQGRVKDSGLEVGCNQGEDDDRRGG